MDRYCSLAPADLSGGFENIRNRIAVFYSLVGILLLATTSLFRSQIYTNSSADTVTDLWRYGWVLPFVFFGVALRALTWRKYPVSPWPAYWKYLIVVAAGGFLFFAGCHSFLSLDNWLYYPTSAIVVLGFGTVPGRVLEKIVGFGG